jgi:hypothetical protein
MRSGVLFALFELTGCELVFPLEEATPITPDSPDIERRPSFNAQVLRGTALELELPSAVARGDYIVGTIQSASFLNQMTVLPVGWQQFDEFPDGMCTNAQWHAWIVAARIDDETQLTFAFDDTDDISGLFVPYVGASAVSYLRRLTPINLDLEQQVIFPSAPATPGTILHIGQLGDIQVSDDPVGMARIGAFDHIVAFDLALPDGEIPQIAIKIPSMTCLGAAELKVEP